MPQRRAQTAPPPRARVAAAQKDPITLKVNKLSSVKTQLPYEYYSLPYCRPERIVPFAENLGEVLRGDRIENSLYQVGNEDCCDAHVVGPRCGAASGAHGTHMRRTGGSARAGPTNAAASAEQPPA